MLGRPAIVGGTADPPDVTKAFPMTSIPHWSRSFGIVIDLLRVRLSTSRLTQS